MIFLEGPLTKPRDVIEMANHLHTLSNQHAIYTSANQKYDKINTAIAERDSSFL